MLVEILLNDVVIKKFGKLDHIPSFNCVITINGNKYKVTLVDFNYDDNIIKVNCREK